jgi:ABC-2 type transport system ATP-binding protein
MDPDNRLIEQAAACQQLLIDRGFYELDAHIARVAAGLGVAVLGMEKKIELLSGGQRAKVILAKLLLEAPDVLIMDEPTVAIDPPSRNHILESVKKIAARGTTILYTSHYMEEVQEICSRIAVMDAGRVIAQGTVDELVSQIQHE